MDLTDGSETSAKLNLMPGKYPKEHIQDSEHGENLKSRKHQVGLHYKDNAFCEAGIPIFKYLLYEIHASKS
jgi:hypothetical protein